MTWDVSVTRSARRDLDEAVAWYLAESPEQVERLLADFDSAIQQVRRHPGVVAPFVADVRRARLRIFPYQAWYLLDTEQQLATVVAVVHDRQDHRHFQERG